ncbi:MAG TPA: DUF2177 family protein [Candidatus Nanoarchaeia archaeon]|nr:DUF2177 family protein [Candidatus Nanoarchaeia archaeon]
MNKVLLFFIVLAFILAVDFLFLTIIMKKFYDTQLKPFSRILRLWAGLIAWALIALGTVILVVPFADKLSTAAVYGAIFGLVLYGVYDFTNFAILKDYKLAITLVDCAWGTFLCTLASVFAFFIKAL